MSRSTFFESDPIPIPFAPIRFDHRYLNRSDTADTHRSDTADTITDTITDTDTEQRSLSDVFRMTGFTPTVLRQRASGIPRLSQTNSTLDPSLTGTRPSTSTPVARPKKTASAPRRNQRQQAAVSTLEDLQRPRISSAPEVGRSSPNMIPAVATNKRTLRELKQLQNYNNNGLTEQSLDELPCKRTKRARQI